MQAKVMIGLVSKAPFFNFDSFAVWGDALIVDYSGKRCELARSYFQLDSIEFTLLKNRK